MFTKVNNWIWMVLCLVALQAAVSCGAGSPLALDDEALQAPDAASQELEPLVADVPALPKTTTEWFDPHIQEILVDLMFDLRHVSVSSGVNVIDPLAYMLSSSNVVDEAAAVDLNSSSTAISYVTYGLRHIPADEDITKIVVRGSSDASLFNPGQGVFIGISDYADGNIRWFGPFGTENEYTVNLWNIDTANSAHRGYVTIAVYGGDTYTVEELEITVGSPFIMPEFHWEMYDLRDLLGPEGFIHEGIVGPPVPPVEPPIGF